MCLSWYQGAKHRTALTTAEKATNAQQTIHHTFIVQCRLMVWRRGRIIIKSSAAGERLANKSSPPRPEFRWSAPSARGLYAGGGTARVAQTDVPPSTAAVAHRSHAARGATRPEEPRGPRSHAARGATARTAQALLSRGLPGHGGAGQAGGRHQGIIGSIRRFHVARSPFTADASAPTRAGTAAPAAARPPSR